MGILKKVLPHYGRRIEDLREFRDEYTIMISRVHQGEGDVYVELPESPEKHELDTLNHDLRGRLVADDEDHFVPENKHEEILQEMEAIESYTEDSITMLKRRDLIWITVTVTFAILGLLLLRDFYL